MPTVLCETSCIFTALHERPGGGAFRSFDGGVAAQGNVAEEVEADVPPVIAAFGFTSQSAYVDWVNGLTEEQRLAHVGELLFWLIQNGDDQ